MITAEEKKNMLLLDALRCALQGRSVGWNRPISDEELWGFVRLARGHGVLPMAAEAVWGSPAAEAESKAWGYLFDQAQRITLAQAQRTADFLLLYDTLAERGLRPIITKGIICRSVYPHPDQRLSVDEDMLIGEGEMGAYHAAMLEMGFILVDPEADLDADFEISYKDEHSGLYIEIHKTFFAPESVAYGDCNALFTGAAERGIEMEIGGTRIRTFAPTDHLLYLICHAYKHFLHSGVGIRQASDVCVFEERFRSGIDGARIRSACESLSISRFAAAILLIGRDHFGIEPLEAFSDIEVDTEPLLLDMLTGGLYGTEDVNRAHSSTMTLEAVASHKEGRRSRGALHSVFLPKRDLEGRYPYLKKHGWLLPIAWIERGAGYLKSRKASSVSPSESLRIGRERVELLKKYGIID